MPQSGLAARPALDRSLIGRRSESSVVRIDAAQLKFFAKATDQRDPAYFDEATARAAGYPALPVPLTFAYSLAIASPAQGGFGLVLVNADARYLLHAEQGFRYHRPLFAGDSVTITTMLLDLYEKKGGQLQFVVQRTDLVNGAGILCVDYDTTFVLRYPELEA